MKQTNESGQSTLGFTAVIVLIVLVVAALVLGFSFHRIDIGHAGVVISYNTGAISATDTKIETVVPGNWFWVLPWDFKAVVDYPMAQQTLTMVRRIQEGKVQADDSVECQVKGGAKINVDSSTIWRVDPENVAKLYLLRPGMPIANPNSDQDISDQIVRREVRNAITYACVSFSFEGVFDTDRIKMGQSAADFLGPELRKSHLLLDSFVLGEIFPQKEQQDGMNAVVNAQLAVKTSSYYAEKATNEAKAAVETAEGSKEAKIRQAQGEAEYVRIINEQLSNSPKFIEYNYSQRWNGAYPTTLVLSDGRSMPLLAGLNLSSTPAVTTTNPTQQPAPTK